MNTKLIGLSFASVVLASLSGCAASSDDAIIDVGVANLCTGGTTCKGGTCKL